MENKNKVTEVVAVLLVAAIAISGFALIGAAEEHEETNEDKVVIEYDTDEQDDINVPYQSILEVTGENIEDGEEYVLEYSDSVIRTDTAENGVITLDTSYLDELGDYTYADEIEGEVNIEDQETDGESVVVESADANVDYRVAVYNDEEERLGVSDVFDEEEAVSDLFIELNEGETVVTGDEVTVVVYDEETQDSLATDTADILADDGTTEDNTVVERSELTRFVAGFTVVESETEIDERLIIDAQEQSPIQDVYVGQQLILADDSFNTDETVFVEYVTEDERDTVTELPVSESDTVRNAEVRVDTTYESASHDELTGDFELVNQDGEELVSWKAIEHNISATSGDDFINLNQPDLTTEIDVASDRLGFTVEIYTEQEPEEILNVLQQEELEDHHVVEIVEEEVREDEEDIEQHIRIHNFAQDVNEETLEFDFSNTQPAEYNFEFEAADSTAETSASFETEFGPQGEAEFDRSTYAQNQGDIVQYEIDLTATDNFVFDIDDDGFDVEFEVEDQENIGSVTVLLDTYAVTEGDVIGDAFSVENEDNVEIVDSDEPLPSIDGNLSTGLYTTELYVDEDISDVATTSIVERESHDIQTHVYPNQATLPGPISEDLEEVRGVSTEQDMVAHEDMLVVEIEASGMESILGDNPHPAALIDFDERNDYDSLSELEEGEDVSLPDELEMIDEISVTVHDEEPGRNVEPNPLPLEYAEDEVLADADADTYYIVMDTNRVTSERYTNSESYKQLGEHDVHFDITEDYHFYVEEEEDEVAHESQDLNHVFELVERTFSPQLNTITVDEPTLDTRFELPAEEVNITSETYIAPGTEVSFRLISEGEVPVFEKEPVEVTDEGTVTQTYDLSGLEIDREVDMQYHPVDDIMPAIIVEPHVGPEITSLEATPSSAETGDEIGFDYEIENADASDLAFDWSFGDDTESPLPNPIHSYEEEGTYDVDLVVTDSEGETATATTTVDITEVVESPIITEVVAPEELEFGEAGEFAVIASNPNGDQADLTYEWDFGDGSSISTGPTQSHTFDGSGVFTVEVTVTNAAGESVSDIMSVTVEEEDTGPEEHELTVTALDAEEEFEIQGAEITILDDGDQVASADTDGDGVATFDLEDGSYDVQAESDAYESIEAPVEIDGEDNEIEIRMNLEEDDDGNGDDDDDPSQPGFGLLMAIAAIAGIGSVFYYRKQQ